MRCSMVCRRVSTEGYSGDRRRKKKTASAMSVRPPMNTRRAGLLIARLRSQTGRAVFTSKAALMPAMQLCVYPDIVLDESFASENVQLVDLIDKRITGLGTGRDVLHAPFWVEQGTFDRLETGGKRMQQLHLAFRKPDPRHEPVLVVDACVLGSSTTPLGIAWVASLTTLHRYSNLSLHLRRV